MFKKSVFYHCPNTVEFIQKHNICDKLQSDYNNMISDINPKMKSNANFKNKSKTHKNWYSLFNYIDYKLQKQSELEERYVHSSFENGELICIVTNHWNVIKWKVENLIIFFKKIFNLFSDIDSQKCKIELN